MLLANILKESLGCLLHEVEDVLEPDFYIIGYLYPLSKFTCNPPSLSRAENRSTE
jgi:hypothetical protein